MLKIDGFRGVQAFCAVLATAAGLAGLPAQAQSNFPARPVRVINPLPTGGALDVLLRRIGQAYQERTGQGFVVDSRPGANTIIAAEACSNAAPDGYTICLLTSSTVSLNPSLYKKLPYEIPKSYEPITQLVFGTQVMIIQPSIPATNMEQFVAYSKANPGKINYSSLGVGGDVHLAMEWLNRRSGTDWTHVPYKGFPPLLTGFTAGEFHAGLLLIGNPNLVSMINAGQMRALMVSGAARSPLLPSVPTFAEAGIPLETSTWFGMFAPAGTPREIVAKLAGDIGAIVRSEDFKTRYLVPAGFDAVGSTPQEFARFIAADVKKGAALVKISGVALD